MLGEKRIVTEEEMTGYQPVSAFVLPTILSAIFCCSAMIDLMGLLFVLPTLLFGMLTLISSTKYGLVGRRPAAISVLFALSVLLIEPVQTGYRFLSEAPVSYKRVAFEELVQNDNFDSLIGQRVCLKGHALFHSFTYRSLNTPTNKFVLSANGDPFSSQDDSIIVEIANKQTLDAEILVKPLAVSGILMRTESKGSIYPRYRLKDAIIRESKTKYMINSLSRGGC